MSDSRPNILWILCDELRTDALSAYGNVHPEIRTPNIDRLAAMGAVFDQCFTASPVCVPARTSLLTGRGPDETGVYGNEAAETVHPIADGLVAFTNVLSDAGWWTSDFGKEHLPESFSPWDHHDPDGASMKELVAGTRESGASITRTPGLGFAVAGVWPSNKDYPPARVTKNAISKMASSSQPFLVRASYLQPHTPVIVPEPWASHYSHVDFAGAPWRTPDTSDFEAAFANINGGERMSREDFQRAQVLYHGAVAWVDDQVGQLLDALEELGLAGNTIIALTSDHGAHLGDDGAYGKHTFAPVSHRVPLLIADPARIAAGTRRSDLAHSTDFARTMLESCGVVVPDEIGGRDLVSGPAPEKIISVVGYGAAASRAFPNKGVGKLDSTNGWPQRFCVRTQRFRLDMTTRINGTIANPAQHDIFLADRLADPDERINVARDPRYQDVRESLSTALLARAESAFRPDDASVYASFVPPAGGSHGG